MGSPLNRTAPPSRLAVRHDRPQSGWCTVDDRLLVAAVRQDEDRHARALVEAERARRGGR